VKRQLIKDILLRRDFGAEVIAAGWVRTRRDSKGGFSFLELNDGSSLASLQVVADGGLANYQSEVLRLSTGAAIAVTGVLADSPGAGQPVELKARLLTVYGYADAETYPIQKKQITYERLRELAHLRPRTNTFGAVARVRNDLASATHRFFQERGFLYLHAPIITSSDAEGAGEMFRVTTLDPGAAPRQAGGSVDYAEDFFGRPAFLTVSGQLEAEAYACALDRVYTFGPTFRAENSNTRRHLAEFWMIEPEMAFADLADNADLAEEYVRDLCRGLLERCPEDLAFFDRRVQPGLVAMLEGVAGSAFQRLTYTEAMEILEKAGPVFEFPVAWGRELQSEHERYLTETALGRPVIVTDFPFDIKAFYMRRNDDERTVAAMDVLVPGIGEIVGGSQREERLEVLLDSARLKGLDLDLYWWYADLRRFGTVPHAGFGVGFERLVQFCTGMTNIRDASAFPRTPKSADF
jgi:asparaginyl-tRNA synthetase